MIRLPPRSTRTYTLFPYTTLVRSGGTELALACRYRIASNADTTRIGLPEVKLGIYPGWGGSVRLPLLVGAPAAMDMMLTGRALSANAARLIGLVAKVTEPALLLDAALELAKRAIGRAPGRDSVGQYGLHLG